MIYIKCKECGETIETVLSNDNATVEGGMCDDCVTEACVESVTETEIEAELEEEAEEEAKKEG